MKKILPVFFCLFFLKATFAQVSQVTIWPDASGNIVTGLSNFNANEAIYLASEVGTTNFLNAGTAIDRIGFNLSIAAAVTSFSGYNVYLKELTPTTDMATGVYSTAGYTLVYSGTLTAAQVGWTYIDLTTPFIRTSGSNNLQILLERTTLASGVGIEWRASVGNSNDVAYNNTHFTSRRFSGTSAPVSGTTSLIQTAFRPMLYLAHKIAQDATIDRFNNLPANSCHTANQALSFTLKNLGTSAIAIGAATATLTLTNANSGTFTSSNNTSISPGGTEVISFTGININNTGTNDYAISVNLAGDVNMQDNVAATSTSTLPVITAFPSTEDMETTGFTSFKSFRTITGTRQLWRQFTGSYTNASQAQPLSAHGGTKFILYDAFFAPTSSGTGSRYYSDCFSLAAGSCPTVSFWMSHDNTTARPQLDSMYVSVSTDKGATWIRQNIKGIGAGLQRHDASLTANAAPIWRKNMIDLSAFAGQTIQIGFEGISKFGNAFGLDDIELTTTVAANVALQTTVNTYPLTQGCDEAGFTYYNDAAGKTVLEVEWGTNTASKTAAIATLTLDATNFAATTGSGSAAKGTFTMKRYWDINVGSSQPITPVNVRFFYDAAEKNSVDAAAASFQLANSGSAVKTATWFKTNSGSFVGDVAHVTADAVVNAQSLADANSSASTINGILYAQFNGITSFSGGTYAAGVGSGSVLPISIEYFKGSKQNNKHQLEWKINCTTSAYVTIFLERSADGRTFTDLQQETATDVRCLQSFNYTDNSPLAGANYYRLKTISPDGKVAYSTIVLLLNKEKGFQLVGVSPNPVKAISVLTVSAAKAGKLNITITEVAGKAVSKFQASIIAGNNFINLNCNSFAAGTYIITAVNEEGTIKTTKLVKY